MLKVNKEQEPDFLLEYKRRYNPKSWAEYDKDNIRNEIKENILILEQGEYCPYCEKKIYKIEEGHIEHIKPRDIHPRDFQNYYNLLVSCNEKIVVGFIRKIIIVMSL